MRTAKKTLAILLTLVAVITMSGSVFAAAPGEGRDDIDAMIETLNQNICPASLGRASHNCQYVRVVIYDSQTQYNIPCPYGGTHTKWHMALECKVCYTVGHRFFDYSCGKCPY